MIGTKKKLDIFQPFNQLPKISLSLIQETAKIRWFKTSEIYYILNNVNVLISHGWGISLNTELHTPPSTFLFTKDGSIYLFQNQKTKREWKKDGHDWVKRKDSIHVREDVERLRYCGQPVLNKTL